MRAISHRGLWRRADERNTLAAFERSFESGFGAEIDVRDRSCSLVIAHDPPSGGEPPLRDVLEAHRRLAPHVPLALNIKSCGLAPVLADAVQEFQVREVFVFDMAVPDALSYVARALPAFTRISEHEREPAFYPLAAGVWIDCFHEDWADERVVAPHLAAGKAVCLVSPELHGRPHDSVWERWAAMSCAGDPKLFLCTDHPEAARRVFGDTGGSQG